jgi:fused signal recognition particle receptor
MGFFAKLSESLKKTKENLGKKLFNMFSARELNDEFYEELEETLITSDFGVNTSMDVVEKLKDEIYKKKIKKSEDAKELFRKILTDIVDYEIPEYKYLLVILVSGVNGVGKTTAIGKLANIFKKEGKSVIVAAADTFRAAASDQLSVWAERAGVRIIKHSEGSDPAAVVFDAVASAKSNKTDVLLIDTAGRLQNKKNLMEELKKINRVVERDFPEADYRSYIVLDATTGQNAVTQAEVFNEAINIDGIILTKLDGTAKGGVVVAISSEYSIPILYVGIGEKIDDLIPFNADDFIKSII